MNLEKAASLAQRERERESEREEEEEEERVRERERERPTYLFVVCEFITQVNVNASYIKPSFIARIVQTVNTLPKRI